MDNPTLERRLQAKDKLIAELLEENKWMRREVERVGRALFTGTKTGYVGTEEDLHAIGQFVEGVCDALNTEAKGE